MPEVRVDPLTGFKTIVAAERATRPGAQAFRVEPAPPIDPDEDPFVDGHEDRTPPEVYARAAAGGGARHARLDRAGRAQPLPGADRRRRRAARATPTPTCSPRAPPPAHTR